MREHWELGRRWRQFSRKHGLHVFVVVCVLAAMTFVALLMYLLTVPNLGSHR